MQDQTASKLVASRYQVIAGRFQLLGVVPASTSMQIDQAFLTAREQAVAPNDALTDARDALKDLSRRLPSELAYPLDSTMDQVSAFYANPSGDIPELLPAADNFPALSRANFLALHAARKPASAELLLKLVDAHAAVDATKIFEILRDHRSRAGLPPPSLVDVGRGLQELTALHFEIAIAAYDPIRSAADPLLGCALQVVSTNDRYRLEALSGLLEAYRLCLADQNRNANHDLDAAFDAVTERADDSSLDQFEKALNDWIYPIAPLMLLDARQKRDDNGADNILARARDLLADMIARGDHENAQKLAAICFKALSRLPGLYEPFEQAAIALQHLTLETKMRPLEDLIQNLNRQLQPLAAAIDKKGFGNGSIEPARELWEAFSRAIGASHTTELPERPWMSIRGLAFQLSARPESAKAASRMIGDLLQYAEALPATPIVLQTFRDDLSTLKTDGRNPAVDRPNRWLPKLAVVVTVSAAALLAFVGYLYFDRSFLSLGNSAQQEVPKEEPQSIPPASKGERFKLDFVRYCHFQEERLRVIKQHVRGPEDIQAYNMLANDYNSRCSNFYYLDEDLKIVTEEVKAKKQILEADAMRILSTWPWHSAKPAGK